MRFSANQKQETITSVNIALNILSQQMARSNRLIEVNHRSGREILNSIRGSMGVFNTYVTLVIGKSQQRRIKRQLRRWDLQCESLKIAKETDASYDEIFELFMSLMGDYIDPT